MFPMEGEGGGLDLGTAITAAQGSILDQVGGALGPALIVGGGILAVTIGWRLFKRFARG